MSCYNCKRSAKQKQVQYLEEKVNELNKKIAELEKSLKQNTNKDLTKNVDLKFFD